MKTNPRWINPYVPLCEGEHPGLISCLGADFSEVQLRRIQQIASRAERLYCEIGSGSGAHLIAQAARDTHSVFVGFELRYKRAYRCAQKARKQGLDNVLVLRANANLVAGIFAPATLSGIYVNFPDPWSKRRWHKHRTLSADFMNRAAALLRSGGFISYKTDHREYFEATLALAQQHNQFSVAKFSSYLYSSDFAALNPASEFEHLFCSKGLPIYFAEFSRI